MSWPKATIWPCGRPLPGVDVSGDPDPFIVEKEMSLTHDDFFRIIPRAFGTEDFKKTDTGAVLVDGNRRFEISLGPERIRKIALLEMQVCDLRLELSGYSETERDAALHRFELMFRKGGG